MYVQDNEIKSRKNGDFYEAIPLFITPIVSQMQSSEYKFFSNLTYKYFF